MMLPMVVLVLFSAHQLPARDVDFDDAVEEMESRLGKSRLRIPLLGLAAGIAGFAGRPLGAKDFKMAIFEDVRPGEQVMLSPFDALPPVWRPIVRVRERHETVHIYGKDEGDWVRLWMAVVERHEVVMMQFKLRPTRLMGFIASRAWR
ncbi:MAG: hypothetical protein SFV51_23275 [Bryobacteraceae bacterium]|nr:hypothetical protein [Bryobacteraceae bacterium]